MTHFPIPTTVTAYFDTPTTPVFILNDAVKGKLDDTTYVLAGDVATDITADVLNVNVRRGRSRWLDQIIAGSCGITVDNMDGDYNPTGGGAYSANVVPGKRIQIDVGGLPIFDGIIEDWDVNYLINGDSTASAIAADALASLGRKRIDSYTTTSELSGARIEDVLTRPEVDYPLANTAIDTGLTTLQADTISSGVDVLSYLQLVSRTESGRLFAAADGTVTFQQRNSSPSTADVPVFADDGTGIPFDQLAVEVGSELLFNRAEVTRKGGTTQIEDNTASQNAYGIRTVIQNDLLFVDDLGAESYAEYLVNKYATPEVRFSTLGVSITSLTTMQAATVCNLELGDVIQVKYTAPGNEVIDRYAVIEGIQHDITISRHTVQFSLSSLGESVFVLDDQVLGVLDGDAVLSY